jgi:hypothetical protein
LKRTWYAERSDITSTKRLIEGLLRRDSIKIG